MLIDLLGPDYPVPDITKKVRSKQCRQQIRLEIREGRPPHSLAEDDNVKELPYYRR